MYKAIRKSVRNKPKEPILVNTEHGITNKEEDAVNILTEFLGKPSMLKIRKVFLK